MTDKYDINILYHILNLKHKSIVRKKNITKEGLSSKLITPLNHSSYLEITYKDIIYVLETKDREHELLRVSILEHKSTLEHMSNLTMDKILIKLNIKKRVESSHSYYCEFCESWIKDSDNNGFRSAHISQYHLPIEL